MSGAVRFFVYVVVVLMGITWERSERLSGLRVGEGFGTGCAVRFFVYVVIVLMGITWERSERLSGLRMG